MTRGQFRAFTSNQGAWEIDKVLLHNQGTVLVYQSNVEKEDEAGIDGRYFEISQSGRFRLGTYERGGQYITDANFTLSFAKNFASQNEAIQYIWKINPDLRRTMLAVMLGIHKQTT